MSGRRSPLVRPCWTGMLCAENAGEIAERAQQIFGDRFFTFVQANSYSETSERFSAVDVDTSQRLLSPFEAHVDLDDATSVRWQTSRLVCGVHTAAMTESEGREGKPYDWVMVSFEHGRMTIDHYAPARYRLQWVLIVEDHTDYDAQYDVTKAVEALHRPWYEIDGVRHDHTVLVTGKDVPADHVCRIGPEHQACITYPGYPDETEHEVLACVECRQTTQDGEPGHPLWPCPTIRAVRKAVDR